MTRGVATGARALPPPPAVAVAMGSGGLGGGRHYEIDRCEAEIRRCKDYAGSDDLGALLGWVDWEAEKWLIEQEESDD